MKKLPIGKQTFATLIEGGYLYVDKTATIHRLVTQGDAYFLSWPRRFGKSLLVSTLRAIFDGRRGLFKFRLHGTAEEALGQIRSHEHALKFRDHGKRIRCFGVAFDPAQRNIGRWIEG